MICVLFAACKQSPSAQSEGAQAGEVGTKVVHRVLDVGEEFNALTNVVSFDVACSAGDCSVEVEGDSTLLESLTWSVDGGMLTLSLPVEEDGDVNGFGMRNGVKVWVKMPRVRILANCGNGRIAWKGLLEGDEVVVGGLRGGEIEIDSVRARSLRYEGHGSSAGRFGQVEADDVQLVLEGDGATEMNLQAKVLQAYGDGTGAVHLTGSADSASVWFAHEECVENEVKIKRGE